MAEASEPLLETCVACGAQFTCGALGCGSCWCAAVPVKLPVTGTSCYCPDCLAARIAALTASNEGEGGQIGVATSTCRQLPSPE